MTLGQLIYKIISDVLRPTVSLLVALAVVFFLVGVVKFMFSVGDETKRKEGKNMMIYGVIGLFVMISVWGLVGLLTNTFFGGNNARPDPNDRSRFNFGILPGELEGINDNIQRQSNSSDSESMQDIFNRINQ